MVFSPFDRRSPASRISTTKDDCLLVGQCSLVRSPSSTTRVFFSAEQCRRAAQSRWRPLSLGKDIPRRFSRRPVPCSHNTFLFATLERRAPWLRREDDSAIGGLDQSVHLSPSYALPHYALSFVHCQTGNPTRDRCCGHRKSLSPLDPMLFGMHGTRTFALLRLGKIPEAADSCDSCGTAAELTCSRACDCGADASGSRPRRGSPDRTRANPCSTPDYTFRRRCHANSLLAAEDWKPQLRFRLR